MLQSSSRSPVQLKEVNYIGRINMELIYGIGQTLAPKNTIVTAKKKHYSNRIRIVYILNESDNILSLDSLIKSLML
jgi:hypothetical protein